MSLPRQYAILSNQISLSLLFKFLFVFNTLIMHFYFAFFRLLAVHGHLFASFDHSSEAVGWQPKAYCNLNFQPENVFIVLILTL